MRADCSTRTTRLHIVTTMSEVLPFRAFTDTQNFRVPSPNDDPRFESRVITYLEYHSPELDIGNGNRRRLPYRLMVEEHAQDPLGFRVWQLMQAYFDIKKQVEHCANGAEKSGDKLLQENAVLKAELKQTKARAVELDRQLKLLQAKQKEEAVK